MKSICLGIAAFVLAGVAFLSSAPIVSSVAYASKMDGKGYGCSDNACRGVNSSSNVKSKKSKSGS